MHRRSIADRDCRDAIEAGVCRWWVTGKKCDQLVLRLDSLTTDNAVDTSVRMRCGRHPARFSGYCMLRRNLCRAFADHGANRSRGGCDRPGSMCYYFHAHIIALATAIGTTDRFTDMMDLIQPVRDARGQRLRRGSSSDDTPPQQNPNMLALGYNNLEISFFQKVAPGLTFCKRPKSFSQNCPFVIWTYQN